MVLLIGGHQRSGTTLLHAICNHHPDIALTLEFGNFIHVGIPYGLYGKKILERWWNLRHRPINATRDRGRWNRAQNLIFALEFLVKIHKWPLDRVNITDLEAALRSMSPSAKIVGDKYPDYVFLLDRLTREKGLSLLMVYRDCRDVVSSTLRKARTEWRSRPFARKADTAEKAARRWLRAIKLLERHAGQVHTIRYEALVQDPTPHLRALGKWLGVDPGGFPEEIITDTSIGKFKDVLSAQELDAVLNIAGPTMARLGYL